MPFLLPQSTQSRGGLNPSPPNPVGPFTLESLSSDDTHCLFLSNRTVRKPTGLLLLWGRLSVYLHSGSLMCSGLVLWCKTSKWVTAKTKSKLRCETSYACTSWNYITQCLTEISILWVGTCRTLFTPVQEYNISWHMQSFDRVLTLWSNSVCLLIFTDEWVIETVNQLLSSKIYLQVQPITSTFSQWKVLSCGENFQQRFHSCYTESQSRQIGGRKVCPELSGIRRSCSFLFCSVLPLSR